MCLQYHDYGDILECLRYELDVIYYMYSSPALIQIFPSVSEQEDAISIIEINEFLIEWYSDLIML